MVVLAFYHHDKISEKSTSKEERFISAHNFRGFSSSLLAPMVFALW
jgi:hypothetical protein